MKISIRSAWNSHVHDVEKAKYFARERERERERERVNWCFEPSQPLGITSGLKETFIKRYKVERTNTAEGRPKEQRKRRELPGELIE